MKGEGKRYSQNVWKETLSQKRHLVKGRKKDEFLRTSSDLLMCENTKPKMCWTPETGADPRIVSLGSVRGPVVGKEDKTKRE